MSISPDLKWNFHPKNDLSPNLPPYSWQGNIIAGFSSKKPPVELGDLSLTEALLSIYEKLPLVDIARFHQTLKSSNELQLIDWEVLCQSSHLSWNQNLEKTLDKITRTPVDFQDWSREKGLGIKDWAIFLSVDEPQVLSIFLTQVSKKNPSYQIGKQILEWSIETFLMGTSIDDILPQDSFNATDWHKKIKELRFPQTHKKDHESEKLLKKLPRPPHIKMNWRRQGDLAGIHTEFFSPSTSHFSQFIERLDQFQKHVIENEETLWSNQ